MLLRGEEVRLRLRGDPPGGVGDRGDRRDAQLRAEFVASHRRRRGGCRYGRAWPSLRRGAEPQPRAARCGGGSRTGARGPRPGRRSGRSGRDRGRDRRRRPGQGVARRSSAPHAEDGERDEDVHRAPRSPWAPCRRRWA